MSFMTQAGPQYDVTRNDVENEVEICFETASTMNFVRTPPEEVASRTEWANTNLLDLAITRSL